MSHLSLPLLLRVPTPTQSNLSFCEPTPRDMKRWIAELPKANLGEMARQLYQGLGELNQLLTSSDNRLQLLELLRSEVYFVCRHLERHFINQSVVLDERPRKVANLCQALQNHLAIGYKQIIARIAPKLTKDRATLLATALQRAMHALNGPLLRANQLYCPVQEGLWLELHQIYQIALQTDLHRVPVPEPTALQSGSFTVEQTYGIALLAGTARCNQMRQQNITRLSQVLESWSVLVRIQPADKPGTLFALSPTVDAPPRYLTLFDNEPHSTLVGLDPSALVASIQRYIDTPAEQRDQLPLPVPAGFTTELLQHLTGAWGDISERSFQRMPGQGALTVCIGMSAIHYFASGEQSFSGLLKIPAAVKAAEFMLQSNDSKDPWASAFESQRGQGGSDQFLPYEEIEYRQMDGDTSQEDRENYPTYPLNIVNHSPGGYCLAWPRIVPPQLQTGEILGIRDTSQGWSIAVVRWVRQVRNGGTQMGIELVAPFAEPCGLQLVKGAERNSQYMRALLLPEIRAIDAPATVLTPRLPFQEGSQVMINTHGEETPAILGHKRTGTGSYSQFEYRPREPVKKDEGGSRPDQEFDSLWETL